MKAIARHAGTMMGLDTADAYIAGRQNSRKTNGGFLSNHGRFWSIAGRLGLHHDPNLWHVT
ncbi:MAG: hypothetical protein KJ889_03230 [Gammaproteobacteria bacterium]|nr:hypothetical protein [Gammaproteobacteria bacterium]